VAWNALSWNSLRYEAPVLFTLRSLDSLPLNRSTKVRIYHGYGESKLKLPRANTEVVQINVARELNWDALRPQTTTE